MDTTNPIEIAVANWTASLNSPQEIINYLNQGNCFKITRNDYNTWNTISGVTCLHVYPAIFDDALQFVVVDNVTDANEVIDYDMVKVKPYRYGADVKVRVEFTDTSNGSDITTLEGLERVFRWMMNKNQWVTDNAGVGDGIFQAFHVPYSDLDTLFADGLIDDVYVLIGLVVGRTEYPDLLLWNEISNFTGSAIVADVSRPVPPFGIEDPVTNYQILLQSE